MEKISLEAYSLGTYEILSLDTERSIQKTIFQQLTSLFTTGTQTSETHRHIYAHDGQPASVAVLLHTIREQMADKQYPLSVRSGLHLLETVSQSTLDSSADA